MKNKVFHTMLGMMSALALIQAAPAFADPAAADQPAPATTAKASDVGLSDVIVTARRVEERLQDVPISITVFSQQQLNNRNIVNAADLATYTPSLSVNTNFGTLNTAFAIRGFVQDIGTRLRSASISPMSSRRAERRTTFPSGMAPAPAASSTCRTCRC